MLKPGTFISDRYEIIDKVGSGGMADVYKARCHRLNRFVAIKVLKPEYSSDKSFVNKFRGEAQSAAGLSHPNIVNVYDVGDDAGLHYIVMELVEGITLKKFIERKGKLEVKEAVGIAIQIAQGMEAAHDNHIIHRDIKPQNIIISRDGKVKVTDFGIAKATNSNTVTSNAMGSVHYLSPEQARGGYSDAKSDIYSLGVTIYEMLSGKVPFAGDNNVSVALLHIQGEAMPLREVDPEIPISIDKIVQKCMQKKAERRYHTASELIIDLKRSLANPDGDFVQIPAYVASDSPTINISDDISKIKSGVLMEDDISSDDMENKIIRDEEEEDLDTVDSKVERIALIGSIAAIVILGITIISIVALFFLSDGRTKKPEDNNDGITAEEGTPTPEPTVTPTPIEEAETTYLVPPVVGLTAEDAEASIRAKSPNANIKRTEDYSDTFEAGKVIAQYPVANSEVEAGSLVSLTISTGPAPVEVPDVYNLTEQQAGKKITDSGLKVIHDYRNSDEVVEGRVIGTEPAVQSIVASGDTIKLIISTGPEIKQAVVPYLIGLTEKNATELLASVGLVKGTVTSQPSSTYKKGEVTFQNTSAAQKVNVGTKIDIIISSGPDAAQTGGNNSNNNGNNNNTGKVRYVGEVTITANPYEIVDTEDIYIVLEMEQEGSAPWVIYEGGASKDDFPLKVSDIPGDSLAKGVVKMYINDVLYQDKTWTAEFKSVEE